MKGVGFEVLKSFWKQIVLVAIIYIVIALIPGKNLVSINLSVIVPVLLYKLYVGKPVFKDWVKTIVVTAFFVNGFFFLISYLGALGLIGFIIIIIIFVAWRLWKGRKLFNYTTKWGADILRGKKSDFDIKKIEEEAKPK